MFRKTEYPELWQCIPYNKKNNNKNTWFSIHALESAVFYIWKSPGIMGERMGECKWQIVLENTRNHIFLRAVWEQARLSQESSRTADGEERWLSFNQSDPQAGGSHTNPTPGCLHPRNVCSFPCSFLTRWFILFFFFWFMRNHRSVRYES